MGFGKEKSTAKQESTTLVAKESNLQAGGDLRVTASKGDINLAGSKIEGENISLKAAQNINVASDSQHNQTRTDSRSSKTGVGISITTSGLGAYLSAAKAKENIKENILTHKGSDLEARAKLSLESGKDTNILGSKVKGERVEVAVGGDLNIASLQEENIYDAKSNSAGLELSTNALGRKAKGIPGGSFSNARTNSRHRTVTDQAGIYAGKGGYSLKVNGNTDLKGAAIDSISDPEKNRLETGTITFSDIENKAEYTARGFGLSYDGKATNNPSAKLGLKGLIPQIPMSSRDEDGSTTRSAVAPGTVIITKPEQQKQDIRELKRDTANTLNKLGPIFDKATVQERQELAGLFGEIAFKQIHELADKNGWKEGSLEKNALHATVGGIMSQLTGGGIMAGASGAMVNEIFQNELAKIKDPALHQWASAIVGATVSQIITGDAQAGASSAVSGTRDNRYGLAKKKELAERGSRVRNAGEARGLNNEFILLDKENEKNLNEALQSPDFQDELALHLLNNPDAETFSYNGKEYVINGYDSYNNHLYFTVNYIDREDGYRQVSLQSIRESLTPQGTQKIVVPIVHSSKVVGGFFEVMSGVTLTTGTGGIFTTVGGTSLVVDGLSNMIEGIKNWSDWYQDRPIGDNNILKNTLVEISPKYGEDIYDGTQLILCVYSIAKNLGKAPEIAGQAILSPKNKSWILREKYPGSLSGKDKSFIIQKLTIDKQVNKFKTIDTICNAINGMDIVVQRGGENK